MQIYRYDTKLYDFDSATRKIFFNFNRTLELIHTLAPDNSQVTFDKDTQTFYQTTFYKSAYYEEFRNLYYKFVKEVIFRLFPNETHLVVQKDPCFRVCPPSTTALGLKDGESNNDDAPIGMHTDADYNHPPEEMNFILGITELLDTNSVYIESAPGKGDFKPVRLLWNEFLQFNGNQCRHYNMKNKIGLSRISIDFRIIPYSKYNPNYEKRSVHGNRQFIVGDYFILMEK